MTLREISYLVLEIIRNSFVVDDERIDHRLIDNLVKTKRVDYINKYYTGNKSNISDNLSQRFDITFEVSDIGNVSSVEEIPSIVYKDGIPLIKRIYNTGSVNEIPFTYVSFNELPMRGNGRFNQNIVFASMDGGHLYLKSKNFGYRLIESAYINAVFNDPEDVPGFNPETSDFPIDYDGIEYIKKDLMNSDLRFMLQMPSDEVNDADGKV